jgi:putative peptidoglycan lipid II flippase
MKLARAMATVGGLTGVSRIAGFARDILTASILGAGPIGDAFFVALKLPNFFRRVTAEGAFSVSFVPVYSESLEQEGRARADLFASNVFMMMSAILSLSCVVAMIFMPWVLYVVAPGFVDDPVRYDLAVELSRITFPYLLAMSLVALLGGVLNAYNKFAPFAFAPVLFNLALIVALLCADLFENAGYAMAWGVAAAGILQFLWLLQAALRSGFTLQIKKPEVTPKVKKVFRLMGPGVIGAGVMHINLLADLIIASFLPAGSVSYLYYADRLNQLPLGIVGIAIGTALLPMLSRAVSAARQDEAAGLFNRSLEYGFLLAAPAAFALAAFAPLLVGGLFERGAFEAADTAVTAQVLMFYVIGLPAYVAVKVFSTVHWAHQDTTTPVKIAVVATVLNIVASIALIGPLGVSGIALATGLAGWVQVILHCRAIKTREGFVFDARLRRAILLGFLACCAMVGGAYAVQVGFGDSPRLLVMVAVVMSGLVIYGLSILGLRVIKPSDLKRIRNG